MTPLLDPGRPLGSCLLAGPLGALGLMSPLTVLTQQARVECGSIGNACGPYDSCNDKDKQGIVETQFDDSTVRMPLATCLNNWQQKDKALKQLEIAKLPAADNALNHHNIGLNFADQCDYRCVLEQAPFPMVLSSSRTEPKNRLIAAKRWAAPDSSER